MSKLQVIKDIRCYLDEKDDAYFNLEDTAKGLGFTETAASGNITIRWRTVRKYLTNFGIATSCDDDLPEFIPEPILYLLSMKAENEIAKTFQHTVAYDILPALRKTGTYSAKKDFPAKSTSAGEVASLTKENRKVMKDQGSSPQKIACQTEKFYKQFGIDVIDNFVEPEPAKWPAYNQVTLEETVTKRITSVKHSIPLVQE